jgi:YVTN family beta-propeller protein
MVFDARPPFSVLQSIDTGPITNHVNIVHNSSGTFAYVTVGGLNEVKVFRTENFALVATIKVGSLPHGIWPSGDGTRVYVGLENADAMTAIDTLTNQVIATVPIGQAPQGLAYVPNAVPEGDGKQGLEPLGVAGQATHLSLFPVIAGVPQSQLPAETTVALFDQGLVQVLQAAATGLEPKQPYVMGLVDHADGSGTIEPLASFMTNPAGSAIVNAIGQIRQVVQGPPEDDRRRYLVIAPSVAGKPSTPVQIQAGATE